MRQVWLLVFFREIHIHLDTVFLYMLQYYDILNIYAYKQQTVTEQLYLIYCSVESGLRICIHLIRFGSGSSIFKDCWIGIRNLRFGFYFFVF